MNRRAGMMEIRSSEVFRNWKEYTLINDNGMSISVLNYGGIITKVIVPDQNNNFENVVLGYKNYKDYETNPHYLGAIIGRVAGRIQEASFNLEGETHRLEANDGCHHLHGGTTGLHQVIWDVTTFSADEKVGLILTYLSNDNDGGYPGNLKIKVTYTLNNNNQLLLDYTASSDKTTPLALTNHTYFNLSGNVKNTVEDHFLTIDSSNYLELNEELVPTGNVINVNNSPFDFRRGRMINEGFNNKFHQNKIVGGGYDHYFIFDNDIKNKEKAVITESNNGRVLTVKTNQPGMVMYTANNLEEKEELREGMSTKHLGVCFETQVHPSSLHHESFPSLILNAGEPYTHQTTMEFSV